MSPSSATPPARFLSHSRFLALCVSACLSPSLSLSPFLPISTLIPYFTAVVLIYDSNVAIFGDTARTLSHFFSLFPRPSLPRSHHSCLSLMKTRTVFLSLSLPLNFPLALSCSLAPSPSSFLSLYLLLSFFPVHHPPPRSLFLLSTFPRFLSSYPFSFSEAFPLSLAFSNNLPLSSES